MLTWIVTTSLRNRMAVLALAAIFALAGVYSIAVLPIDAVPDITNRQVQINALAPSLSSEDMELQVTAVIETAIAGIPKLRSTRSLSRAGFCQITAIFDDGTDIYFARQQIAERLSALREALPRDVEPRMGPIATGLGEVYTWIVAFAPPASAASTGALGWQPDGSFATPDGEILTTELERATYLRTVQDWIVKPRLTKLPGVAGIDAIGGYVKQYEVQPDPGKLVAFGLTVDELTTAIERANLATGPGYVEKRGVASVVHIDSRFRSRTDIERTVITVRSGQPIFVEDVAAVVLGKELRTGSGTAGGHEVVIGTALMLAGENSRTVAASVDRALQAIAPSLPPGVTIIPALDRTKLVAATIGTVIANLSEGALIVAVILFLTLGNWRAAFICTLIIPLAMLITAVAMVQANVSANLMSLGALDFGLIVDGTIIIVEHSVRQLAKQQGVLGRRLSLIERRDVIEKAAIEMIRPSVFGQLIICIVYLPILALTGVEGKMFHPMASTVLFALVSAFVLSLTLIPVLAVSLLRDVKQAGEPWMLRVARGIYGPVLDWSLRRSFLLFGAIAGLVIGAGVALAFLGQEFVPTLDEFDFAVETRRAPSTGLTQSTDIQRILERKLSAVPEVALVFSRTGTAELATDPAPMSGSDLFIIMKPRAQWRDPREPRAAMIARLNSVMSSIPGSSYEFLQPIQMRFNELLAGARSDVVVKIYGDDLETLTTVANRVADVVNEVRGASDVKVEQTSGQPVLTVRANAEALQRWGVRPAEIHDILSVAVAGRIVGRLYEGNRPISIVMRFPELARTSPDALGALPVAVRHKPVEPALASSGIGEERTLAFLSIADVATVKASIDINQISRENGARRITVQTNVRARDLGSFVAEARKRVADKVVLSPGMYVEWGGQIENIEAARARLFVVVPLCLLSVFALLYAANGSWLQAALMFTGVPFALTGGVLALWIVGLPFSISAAVGFIALSGVAVLNGLVLLSSFNALRADGGSLGEEWREGAINRFRPVLMTALVASLGFGPMALAIGPGAEVQQPLAVVVIGGVLSSAALTLLMLPVLLARLRRYL